MNWPKHIYLIDNDASRNENFESLLRDDDVFNQQLERFKNEFPDDEACLNGLERSSLKLHSCLLHENISDKSALSISAQLTLHVNESALLFLDFGLTGDKIDPAKDQPYLLEILKNYCPSPSRLWVVASAQAQIQNKFKLGYRDTRVKETGAFNDPDYSPIFFHALVEWCKLNQDLYGRFLQEMARGHKFLEPLPENWIKNNVSEFSDCRKLADQLHNLAAGRQTPLEVTWFLAHLVHRSVLPSVDNPFVAAVLIDFYNMSVSQGHSFLPVQHEKDRICALKLFRETFGRLFVSITEKKSTVLSASLKSNNLLIELNFASDGICKKMQCYSRNALESSISMLCKIKTIKDDHLTVSNPGPAHETSGFLVALRQSMHIVDPSQINPGDNICGADADLVVKCGESVTTVEFK